MSLQSTLARVAGDTWKAWRIVAVWPWPAVCVGYPHNKFTWGDYRFFIHQLRPGDMLIMTSDKYFLSNRGISGTAFKHLAVYTGPVTGAMDPDGFIRQPTSLGAKYRRADAHHPLVHERTVTHAVSEGVVCQDLGTVLFHEDYVAIVRPWSSPDEQRVIVQSALSQIGKEYNFDFTPSGPPALYCTELGEFCCGKAGIPVPARERRNVDWKGLLLPLDRFKAYVALADKFALHFPVVGISNLCDTKSFLRNSAWAELLRQRFILCGKCQ